MAPDVLVVKACSQTLLKRNLRNLTADVANVADFQNHVKVGLQNSLDKTTDGYAFGGLDQL